MLLMLLAVSLGLVAGLVAGGSVRNVALHKPRVALLAVLWLALSIITRWTSVTRWTTVSNGRLLFLSANVCAVTFCLVNVKRLSAWLLLVGFALNTLVIAANGAMPYRVSSVITAELATLQSDFPATVQTRPEKDSDRFHTLTDNIAFHAGPIRDVLSIGDILAALGIAWSMYRAMQGTKLARSAHTEGSTHTTEAKQTGRQKKPQLAKPIRHVSSVRIGEEHDLAEDDADRTKLPDAVTVDQLAVDPPSVGAESRKAPTLVDEPDSNPISRLLLDITADKGANSQRYAGGLPKGTAALFNINNVPAEETTLDITDGEMPGNTFWHERELQRSKDLRTTRN